MNPPSKRQRLDAIFAELGAPPAEFVPVTMADARLATGIERDPLPRCDRTGKVGFPSREECVIAMRRVKHRRHTCRHLRAYQCDHCNDWHMTSQPIHLRESSDRQQ